MEYLVKKGELKELPKNSRGSFMKQFKSYTSPFLKKKNFDREKSGIKAFRKNEKAVFVIKNNYRDLYNGKLWNDPDVEMIANMDYMYCLPSWDWGINLQFDSAKYKVENLNHIHGKYGNTVIFVNNIGKKEKYFKKIIKMEGFKILEFIKHKETNNLEFYLFYDYYRVMLPLKLARELNRINSKLKTMKIQDIYLIIRGGYLLSEFIKYPKKHKKIITSSQLDSNIVGKVIVDDCIVMGRNIKKMGANKNSRFDLHCLDCVIPKMAYQKEFPNVKFDLPSDLLSIFSCRIFEKNPYLIGVDVNDEKLEYFDSLVRKKFIKKIKQLQKTKNLNNVVNKIAMDLFSYKNGGYSNKSFEKLNLFLRPIT